MDKELLNEIETKITESVAETYPDTMRIKDFFNLTADELVERVNRFAPALNEDNLAFIRKNISKKESLPSCGELRLCEALLNIRRSLADSLVISALDTDSLAITETYADLMKKAETLHKKKRPALSLTDTADILPHYMRMIGRESYAVLPKSKGKALLLKAEGRPTFTLSEAECDNAPSYIGKDMAIILLRPMQGSENEYEANAKAFFTESARSRWHKNKIKIGGYGIIGALCDVTRGVRADISRLSEGGDLTDVLVRGDLGGYMAVLPTANVKRIGELAEKHSLNGIFFAVSAKTGRFISVGKDKSIDLPLPLLRALKESRKITTARADAPTLHVYPEYRSVHTVKEAEVVRLSDIPARLEGLLVTARDVTVSDGDSAFPISLNGAVDTVLELVARGADRRAICLFTEYRVPKHTIDSAGLGNALAMILGVYRVGVEFATPVVKSPVRYVNGAPSLLLGAYSSAPKASIPSMLSSEGGTICFMGVSKCSDGLVDFTDLRRACDRFTELCRDRKVLSARAVKGSVTDTLQLMSGDVEYVLNEGCDHYETADCRGIVFEVADAEGLNAIGHTARVAVDYTSEDGN